MTERLRIAVLSRNFSTSGGGAERYSIAVVEQLAARHEVHVFAQTIVHEFPGVTYHRVPMPMARPRWINQLYFAWKTWRATRKGFDIVHSHENTWHGNVQTVHVLPVKYTLFAGKHGAALALRWLKVLTSPRLLAYLWLEHRRYEWALKKRIVCASASLKAIMERTYSASSSMLEVVTPGISEVRGRTTPVERSDARRALGLPIEATLLVFVGNDMVKKGLQTLLQAMAQLPDSVQLAVVGQGDHSAAMELAAKALGGRVHFLGAMQDVTPAYLAADALVHPTLEDAYGMVVLEAMAHGLPVVVSGPQWCGIAQDLCDGEMALLLPEPKDALHIVSAVKHLQADANLLARLSANALAFAHSHRWEQSADAYDAMLARSRSVTSSAGLSWRMRSIWTAGRPARP